MTAAVRDRPVAVTGGDGGAPARRAMVRWSWRLYRREWRRQALVLALLIVAVAATTVGLGVASNATNLKSDPTFGTANTIVALAGSDPNLTRDVAALQSRFGTVEVISHQSVAIPGSVSTLDLRAQSPNGPYGHVTLRLDSGRYPTGPDQVAMTASVAKTFGVHVGGAWSEDGRTLQVVGLVENPLDLLDQFVLVAPGQANPPVNISVLLNATQGSLQSFRLPSGTGMSISSRGTTGKTAAEAVILLLGSLGLVFVGLMAVAGFTVMAHRRLRALGMLASLGATNRNIRMVMLANGAAVGATSAILGTAAGAAAWFAFVPALQSISEHRVDPFNLPWWGIGVLVGLTFVTAVAAAWWPARAVARISVLAALSGRPPRPQPAHRFAVLGAVLLATGVVLLCFADRNRAGFIIAGTIMTPLGLLFLAPLAIRALAAASGHSTISIRLALRDLARYQARSGAALGAVTLAIGIAATIAISASAAQTPSGPGNLPANQLMLYLTPAGNANQVPPLSPVQQQTVTTVIDRLATTIQASWVLPLDQAYNPQGGLQPNQSGSGPLQSSQPGQGGGESGGYMTTTLARVTKMSRGEDISTMITLYAATSDVLARYGIKASQINPDSDILSSRNGLSGLQIFDPFLCASRDCGTGAPQGPDASKQLKVEHPIIQILKQLPAYTSDPSALITPHAMQTLGLQTIPAGWLLQTGRPLTTSQIATAQKTAAAAGLYVETKGAHKSTAPLRNWSTAAGILLTLGVLGMTVGLIRSETANDLRTLTATGASSTTRRTITGATAGALALLGAILGTVGAYGALLAWHRSDLSPLGHVPVINLIIILAGLPAIATIAGWLLAGREPAAIARQPLE